MILALQIFAFIYAASLLILIMLAVLMVAEGVEDLPEPKHMAMIFFWPLTAVALTPLVIVFLVKWFVILAGSFSGGIGELYSKAVKR